MSESSKDGCYCQKCSAPVDPTDEKCPNGHVLAEVGRAFVRSASSSLNSTADAIIVRSPLTFLGQAIRNENFLLGVIVSGMYLEGFGKDRIKEYFQDKGVPIEPMDIERLKQENIPRMLEAFGIISQSIHSKWGEVNEHRNKIVHRLRHPDIIDEDRSKRTIEKAIECLKALGVT